AAPSGCQTKTVPAFTALPFTWTTQAPHWEVSQPTWVPVSRRCSRRYCTSRVRGSTSPVTALPFTVSATADMAFLLEIGPKALFFAPTGEADGRTGQNRVDLDFLCSSRVFRWQPYRGALIGNKRRFPAAAKPSCTHPRFALRPGSHIRAPIPGIRPLN